MKTFGDEVDDDDADDLESSPLPFPPLPLSIIILAAIEPDPTDPEASLLPLSAPPPDDGVRNVEVFSMLLDDGGGGFTIVEQRTNEAPAALGVCKRLEDVLMVLVGVGVHDMGLEASFSSGATLTSVKRSLPSPVALALGNVRDSSWSITLTPGDLFPRFPR